MPKATSKIKRQFRRIDKNGDGLIKPRELQEVLQQVKPELFSPDVVSQLFSELDADSDGNVDLNEFVDWVFANAEEDENDPAFFTAEEEAKLNSAPRYHPEFPDVPLTRSVAKGRGFFCDMTGQLVKPGDVLWSNREHDIDIMEQAMPEHMRFHPEFPGVPLARREITAREEGKWICDLTKKEARAGDVVWSNRQQDLDILDIAFQSAASPTAGLGDQDRALSFLKRPRKGGSLSAVDALNQTGMELLLSVLKEPKNTFISPLSISLALSMTANGAQGATLEGMMTALCTEALGGLVPLNEQMRALTSVLKSSDPRVAFHVASSVWSQTLLETFIAVCASAYDAQAFNQAPDPVAINSWCAEKTQNKIDSIVPKDAPLDPEGAMLVNALYFKGEWKNKFDTSRTRPATFFDASGGEINCQMMNAVGEKNKFAYLETNTYQMACLPYGDNGEYSAMIVLPRGDSSPTLSMRGGHGRSGPGSSVVGAARYPRPATVLEVLMDLTTQWKDDLQSIKGTLKFPRFKVESEMELGPLFEARGMQLAFKAGADFGAMSSVPLFISKVIHKTFVEVNEEGTEAAAITAVMALKCLPPPEPVFTMECNRPFLFFIRHEHTKAIIFSGVVLKPE